MKKGGVHIVGYVDPVRSPSSPRHYSNGHGFELRFGVEDEIRMGLWARDLCLVKDQRDISGTLLPDDLLTATPEEYDPFSRSGTYCFIPTCPIVKDHSLWVINTDTLQKRALKFKGGLTLNEFAPAGEKMMIVSGHTHIDHGKLTFFNQLFIYDCATDALSEIEVPCGRSGIEYAQWIDPTTIRLIVSKRGDRTQWVMNYDTVHKAFEAFKLPPPSEVFKFDMAPLEELTTSNRYCLNIARGWSGFTVGTLLNQWSFVNYDRDKAVYRLKTYVPIAPIHEGTDGKTKGIDVIDQVVEYHYDGSGITGEATQATNRELATAAARSARNSSGFWQRLKQLWS